MGGLHRRWSSHNSFGCNCKYLYLKRPKTTFRTFTNPKLPMQLSYLMCQYKYLICPVDYSNGLHLQTIDCKPSSLFILTEYRVLPSSWVYALELFYLIKLPTTVQLYPFVLHSLALSLFSSVVGPFGGFFASGFKRAFKVKDFSDTIPGHGGIVDRFDCQFLMATFTNVYISSFIRAPSPTKLLQQIMLLPPEFQIKIYQTLKHTLADSGQVDIFDDCVTHKQGS